MTPVEAKDVIEIYCRALALFGTGIASSVLGALPGNHPDDQPDDQPVVVCGQWRPLGPKEWGVATRAVAEPGQPCDARSKADKVSRVYLRRLLQPGGYHRGQARPDVWSIAEADETNYKAHSKTWSYLIDVVNLFADLTCTPANGLLLEWLSSERDAAVVAERADKTAWCERMLGMAREAGNRAMEDHFAAELAALRSSDEVDS